MLNKRKRQRISSGMMEKLWGANLFLALLLAVFYFYGLDNFLDDLGIVKTSVNEFQFRNVKSDPFDGTVSPIAYVPNWLDDANMNKALRYENVSADSFVETPRYDADLLRVEDPKNRMARLLRSTYITPYMGSYRMNFEEYDGSHVGVDIRAVLGTPVLATANGVVLKTSLRESGDGIYVVLRHDDVPLGDGTNGKLYSSYLHLEAVTVKEGEKVRKGQQIGRVGMTGITTTPHLHFQIDKDTAANHAYWPFSMRDLNDNSLDFFGAVNVGFGKENGIRNTVHPMQFVQENESVRYAANGPIDVAVAAEAGTGPSVTDSGASAEKPVAALPSSREVPGTPDESSAKNAAPSVEVPLSPFSDVDLPSVGTTSEEAETLVSGTPAPVNPSVPAPAPTSGTDVAIPKPDRYLDVPASSAYAPSVARLLESGTFVVPSDGQFRPYAPITRREAAFALFRTMKFLPAESSETPFADVLPSDDVSGILAKLVGEGIFGANDRFRPGDALTRSEAAILLVRASRFEPRV